MPNRVGQHAVNLLGGSLETAAVAALCGDQACTYARNGPALRKSARHDLRARSASSAAAPRRAARRPRAASHLAATFAFMRPTETAPWTMATRHKRRYNALRGACRRRAC